MNPRANVCVVIFAMIFATGCATPMTKATYERTCERVETVWDEELQQTKIVEYGCVLVEPAKERQTWMLIFQIIGAVVGIAALLL